MKYNRYDKYAFKRQLFIFLGGLNSGIFIVTFCKINKTKPKLVKIKLCKTRASFIIQNLFNCCMLLTTILYSKIPILRPPLGLSKSGLKDTLGVEK